MQKMKSKSGAGKTFRKTASGHYKRKKAYSSHILTSKSRKRKRNLRHATLVSASEEKRVKLMLQ